MNKEYKWKVWVNKGVRYYCLTDESMMARVRHLATLLHPDQKIKVQPAKKGN
jgi:hypothetical protein